MTNPDLAALSAAAWKARFTEQYRTDELVDLAAVTRFHVALEAAYRTGNLVQIDREGMRDKLWQVLEDLMCPDCDGEGKVGGIKCERCQGWGEPTTLDIADAAIAAILGGE